MSPVPAQMWRGVSPVPARMWGAAVLREPLTQHLALALVRKRDLLHLLRAASAWRSSAAEGPLCAGLACVCVCARVCVCVCGCVCVSLLAAVPSRSERRRAAPPSAVRPSCAAPPAPPARASTPVSTLSVTHSSHAHTRAHTRGCSRRSASIRSTICLPCSPGKAERVRVANANANVHQAGPEALAASQLAGGTSTAAPTRACAPAAARAASACSCAYLRH